MNVNSGKHAAKRENQNEIVSKHFFFYFFLFLPFFRVFVTTIFPLGWWSRCDEYRAWKKDSFHGRTVDVNSAENSQNNNWLTFLFPLRSLCLFYPPRERARACDGNARVQRKFIIIILPHEKCVRHRRVSRIDTNTKCLAGSTLWQGDYVGSTLRFDARK